MRYIPLPVLRSYRYLSFVVAIKKQSLFVPKNTPSFSAVINFPMFCCHVTYIAYSWFLKNYVILVYRQLKIKQIPTIITCCLVITSFLAL